MANVKDLFAGIEGFDDMTDAEKLTAIEALQYEDNAAEVERYKNAVSKANKEAAENKRKLNEHLSEEEKKKQADDEELATLRATVEALTKEKTISEHKSKLVGLGFDDALSDATAKAMADGDMNAFFTNAKKFLESHDKAIKAELLKGTPTPPAGNPEEPMTKEKFLKLSTKERYEFSQNNPEEYRNLYGGNE